MDLDLDKLNEIFKIKHINNKKKSKKKRKKKKTIINDEKKTEDDEENEDMDTLIEKTSEVKSIKNESEEITIFSEKWVEKQMPKQDYVAGVIKGILEINVDLLRVGYLNLNTPTSNTSSTLLHTAVWFRKCQLIRILLQYGANPNHQNLKGNVPLHYACEHAVGKKDNAELCILLLLLAGGNVDVPNLDKKTPRMIFPQIKKIEDVCEKVLNLFEYNNAHRYQGTILPYMQQNHTNSSLPLSLVPVRSMESCVDSCTNPNLKLKAQNIFNKLVEYIEKPPTELFRSVYEGLPKYDDIQNKSNDIKPIEKSKLSKLEGEINPINQKSKLHKQKDPLNQIKNQSKLNKNDKESLNDKTPQWLIRHSDYNEILNRTDDQKFTEILSLSGCERNERQLQFLLSYFQASHRKHSFFARLPKKLVLSLLSTAEYRSYNKGDVIFRRGDISNKFYFILQGECGRFNDHHQQHNQHDTLIYKSNDTFGDEQLFNKHQHRRRLWNKLLNTIRILKNVNRNVDTETSLKNYHFADIVVLLMKSIRKYEIRVISDKCNLIEISYRTFEGKEFNYRKQQQHKAIEFFKTIPYCKAWRYQQLRRLALCLTKMSFKKDDIVSVQGCTLDYLYFVYDGNITLQRDVVLTREISYPISFNQWQVDSRSRLVSIDICKLTKGDSFGEEALFDIPLYAFSAKCVTDTVVVYGVPRKQLWQFRLFKDELFYTQQRLKGLQEKSWNLVHMYLIKNYRRAHEIEPLELYKFEFDVEPSIEPTIIGTKSGSYSINYYPFKIYSASRPSYQENMFKSGLILSDDQDEEAAHLNTKNQRNVSIRNYSRKKAKNKVVVNQIRRLVEPKREVHHALYHSDINNLSMDIKSNDKKNNTVDNNNRNNNEKDNTNIQINETSSCGFLMSPRLEDIR